MLVQLNARETLAAGREGHRANRIAMTLERGLAVARRSGGKRKAP